MYLLGIDLGTSSIKVSVINAETQQEIDAAQYPETEAAIISHQTGWAEQDPETWWQYTLKAMEAVKLKNPSAFAAVGAIGISYQMHGLVMVDKNHEVLRPSIIWCDSRAVSLGEQAFEKLGKRAVLGKLLNSPGNFTAAKLAWVKQNEPHIYSQCHKIMLPGDYLAMKLTGEISTTASGLSEGIFWDFETNAVSKDILKVFGFNEGVIPSVKPTFSVHATVLDSIALETGLAKGTPVCYKAGDQPNNALSLNVIEPGEIAATAGTSGVVYAVSDQVKFDAASRINSFAHVNHGLDQATRIGILLCINGTGILNRWIKEHLSHGQDYLQMNQLAEKVNIGADGLSILPFGNGAERMLGNRQVGSQVLGLDFNKHTAAHIFRAGQEGIVYSLAYGFEMMKDLGVQPNVIRAGKANMFLSPVFSDAIVNTLQVQVELYDTHGAKGAALAAGAGLGYYKNLKESMLHLTKIASIEPDASKKAAYQTAYETWKTHLNRLL
jgi:xylulokinase